MAYEALYTRGRPKTLAQLVGQEHISSALTQAISTERLSHAYLLVGTRGTGKTSTARLLAKAMNCETVHKAAQEGRPLTAKEIPCNKCASCLSIDSSPDNVEFDAASNRSVEDVTRLLSTAYLAPLQSRIKTFIIDEVHMLSFEAVNSILKLIEEPPPNVAFFLATTELQKVPMTIRSRCQVLNFRLIPVDTIYPYLIKIAKRLNVELPQDAAKKIARLAEGSMRDALTYLDQCYAMSDKIITLENVEQTLGLISDADLDEIISAVNSKNRVDLVHAVNKAFQSGLNSITIAESLIVRLRDLQVATLNTYKESKFIEIDNFILEIRKAILEMQGSGIPDIILETTLMKLASDKKFEDAEIFFAPKPKPIPQKKSSPPPVVENQTSNSGLDEGKKIFYHIMENWNGSKTLKSYLERAAVKNFDGQTLTLAFRTEIFRGLFLKQKAEFEKNAESILKRSIKVDTEIDSSLRETDFLNLNGDDKNFLENVIQIFESDNIKKIESEE